MAFIEELMERINPATRGNDVSVGIFSRYHGAALAGVVIHQLVFMNGEWHMKAPTVFKYYFATWAAATLFEAIYTTGTRGLSVYNSVSIISTFTLSLLSSIVFYRIFFHRIRHFPGPFLASATKLWHSIQCLDSKNYRVLENLHKQYGDFVRTGPSEVTVFHPEVLAKLDGPGNKCTKSLWYDFLLPHVGVTTIRNKTFHDQRRRIWTKGMSTTQMAVYERHVASQVKQLENIVAEFAKKGESMEFSKYSYWFSFDVMGLFVFSRTFNMLHKEEWHYSVVTLRRAMGILGPLSSVPWLGQIGLKLLKGYWLIKDWHTMIKWCEDRMSERIEKGGDAQDVAHWLIADSKKTNSIEQDHNLLTGDAIVAIIAGSDTVAPTMVFLFYQLALNPEKADKLYKELQGVDVSNIATLLELPYLNAVIKETLRYHPAVPTGGYRDTPPQGMTIGGTYIPGNTTIVAPRYVLSRLESCYVDADKWIPERWTSSPDMVKDDRSNLPFAQGRYTCLGKDIAMTELRMVTASIASKYHVRIPPGFDPGCVERDMKDQFTATPGKLDILFERRK